MDRRAELKQLAKETKTEAGVYQIRNNRSGKVWIHSSRNVKTINGQRFMLDMGSHHNKQLQKEWSESGGDAFTIDVLEVLKKEEAPYFDEQDALKKLEAKWLDRLQPFGERGYNTAPRTAAP